MLSQPHKSGARSSFDFTAALIRRRKAAVTLLLCLSVGVAALALFSFVKLMPVRGDASHSAEVMARIGSLDRALQHASEAVYNKDRTPRESQALWTDAASSSASWPS